MKYTQQVNYFNIFMQFTLIFIRTVNLIKSLGLEIPRNKLTLVDCFYGYGDSLKHFELKALLSYEKH